MILSRFLISAEIVMLSIVVHYTPAQGINNEPDKKNPDDKILIIDSLRTKSDYKKPAPAEKSLPKFELPEYVIIGIASVDLPKLDKIQIEEEFAPTHITSSSRKLQRGYDLPLIINQSQANNFFDIPSQYSGLLRAGIGDYFTPEIELWFGQDLQNINYIVGADYHLTKGYAPYTKQSGGGFQGLVAMPFSSTVSAFDNSLLSGKVGIKSNSYYFYGSSTPDIQRTATEYVLQAGIENTAYKEFPYSLQLAFGALKVTDSSSSATENSINLKAETFFRVYSMPVLYTNLDLLIVSKGFALFDLSGGIKNYSYNDVNFKACLHLYLGKGMGNQKLTRLYPQLTVSYQLNNHYIYLSYKPSIVPLTFSKLLESNKYLSVDAVVKHQDVSNAGEVGVESEWSDIISSRLSFNVQSIKDFAFFSDSLNKGIWSTVYGGKTNFITILAEMVAKFNSNAYFKTSITSRSIGKSYWTKGVPYIPNIEISCEGFYRFLKKWGLGIESKFIGERITDIDGLSKLPSYVMINARIQYSPLDFIKCAVEARNFLGTKYEIWRGYKEFPMTMHLKVQIKW